MVLWAAGRLQPLTNDAPRRRVNLRTSGSGVGATIEVSRWKPPRDLTLVCLDSSTSRANRVLSVQPRARSLWLTWLCEVDSALNPFRSFTIARTTGQGSGNTVIVRRSQIPQRGLYDYFQDHGGECTLDPGTWKYSAGRLIDLAYLLPVEADLDVAVAPYSQLVIAGGGCRGDLCVRVTSAVVVRRTLNQLT